MTLDRQSELLVGRPAPSLLPSNSERRREGVPARKKLPADEGGRTFVASGSSCCATLQPLRSGKELSQNENSRVSVLSSGANYLQWQANGALYGA